MARKKKKVIYDTTYWIAVPTRLSRNLFCDDKFIDLFYEDKLINNYLENNNVSINKIESLNEGKALLFNINIHPDNSISDVIFNIKRLAFKFLIKEDSIKSKLNGEKSIWSQNYAVSFDKNDVISKYYQLITEEK